MNIFKAKINVFSAKINHEIELEYYIENFG